MTSLRGLLNHLRARFEAEGVPFAIGGSLALAAGGHPRYTDDIDVMVLAPDLAPVHRALAPPRFEFVNEVTFRDVETGYTLDIYPVQDDAQRAAFDAATVVPLEGAHGVRVLTPEGACVMLLREATLGSAKQRPLRLRDVELLASEGKLDWEFVRSWARRMGYGEAYAELRAEGKPPL